MGVAVGWLPTASGWVRSGGYQTVGRSLGVQRSALGRDELSVPRLGGEGGCLLHPHASTVTRHAQGRCQASYILFRPWEN